MKATVTAMLTSQNQGYAIALQSHDVSIVGLGFVGLSTAVSFAKLGMKVAGIDIDNNKVSMISKGFAPFHEPGIKELLEATRKQFKVSTNMQLVRNSPLIFITVGTPSKEDGSIDIRFLIAASKAIGSAIRGSNYPLIVVKSTVTPGTLMNVVVPEIERASGMSYGKDFGACSNPEFLREGRAIQDTLHPDRLIIGGSEKDANLLKSFYEKLYGKGMPRTIIASTYNAELIKYANNSFLAMKISFMNQIACICEKLPGGDVQVIAEGIGLDERIGKLFLGAGSGFGGSCFPKDIKALMHFSKRLGYSPPIVEATMKVNEDQPLRVVKMAEEKLGSLEGKKIAVLGLAFKPHTDDMREAVSVKIVEELLRKRANVSAHDPKALKNASLVFGDKIELVGDLNKCLKSADCAILVTEWDEYSKLEPDYFRSLMRKPIVIDGRRLFDPRRFSEQLEFAAIGLGNSVSPGIVRAK